MPARDIFAAGIDSIETKAEEIKKKKWINAHTRATRASPIHMRVAMGSAFTSTPLLVLFYWQFAVHTAQKVICRAASKANKRDWASAQIHTHTRNAFGPNRIWRLSLIRTLFASNGKITFAFYRFVGFAFASSPPPPPPSSQSACSTNGVNFHRRNLVKHT